MPASPLNAAPHKKTYIIRTAKPLYWPEPRHESYLNELPVYPAPDMPNRFTAQWVYVRLPDWASDLEVEGKGLLVDAASCAQSDAPAWEETDWWAAAFHHLNGSFEREVERSIGTPLHSYSFRLPEHHHDLFEYAWVNRICLFLRRWAAHRQATSGASSASMSGMSEDALFPPLPQARFILTHDVDYIGKTAPLIIKKAVFDILKTLRACTSLQFGKALSIMCKAVKFAATPHRNDFIEDIIQMEKTAGYRSIFHVYAGRGTTNRSWLLDPSYKLEDIKPRLQLIAQAGCEVGLHPSYHCWQNTMLLQKQKQQLEQCLGKPVTAIRQHWLRFSWQTTWKAQAAAGLERDTTLMWNDRSGFRNGAALWFTPLCDGEEIHGFKALPTIIMDSHFFDYDAQDEAKQFERLKRYIDEVRFVGGEAATLWHQHTLHPMIGWRSLYKKMLNYIKVVHDGNE